MKKKTLMQTSEMNAMLIIKYKFKSSRRSVKFLKIHITLQEKFWTSRTWQRTKWNKKSQK